MPKKSISSNAPSIAPAKGTRLHGVPFAIGDKVKYRGTDLNLQQQYAGTLEVWEFGTRGDFDRCTCLKPDGRATSWIDYTDLIAD